MSEPKHIDPNDYADLPAALAVGWLGEGIDVDGLVRALNVAVEGPQARGEVKK